MCRPLALLLLTMTRRDGDGGDVTRQAAHRKDEGRQGLAPAVDAWMRMREMWEERLREDAIGAGARRHASNFMACCVLNGTHRHPRCQ